MIEQNATWNEDIGEWQLVSLVTCVISFERENIDVVYTKNMNIITQYVLSVVFLFIPQRFVAYTGNNMRKASPSPDPRERNKEV